ncbi:MAG: hypothetical protein H8E31_11865, partial [Planctomycetes bacterium]|nr:hypothetical protein [Planctomycetota bacterium]
LEVYSAPPGRAVHRAVVPGTPGLHRIVVPTGAIVSGTILGLAGEVDRPWSINLASTHPLHPEWKLPDAARSALGLTWVAPGTLSFRMSEDDGFRFSGLPADWSGELGVSGRQIAEASAGQITKGGWGLTLSRPVTGLELRLAPRAALHGVIVTTEGGPVAKLELVCRYDLETGAYTLPQRFRTDERGAFRVPLPIQSFVELARAELRFDLDLDRAPLFQASGERIPADGDLGELRIDGGGALRFLLLDPRGRPLEGGVVAAGGIRARPTGADGLGTIQPLLAAAERIRATAEGYAPASLPVPRPPPELLEIRLSPCNRLEVGVPALPAEARPNVRLRLAGERGILTPESETSADLEQHAEIPEPWNSTFGPRGEITSLTTRMVEDNQAVFRALAPGVELQLSLVGRFGDPVFHTVQVPALGPAEIRRLEMDLGGALRVFRARVRDQAGTLLVGARLQLDNQSFGQTDGAGELLCLTTKIEPQTLLVTHESCANLYLRDFVAPTDGAVVDLTLGPAYTVVVEVRDEAGALVPDCVVHYKTGGFTSSTRSLGGGRFEITGLGPEPFRIEARRKGRSVWIDHDPAVALAVVTFPLASGGKVAVRLRSDAGFPEAQRYSAILSAVEAGGEHLGIYGQQLEPSGFDFEGVPPGEYRFLISYFPSDQEQAEGMESRTVVQEDAVTVTEGRTTELEVDVSGEMSRG